MPGDAYLLVKVFVFSLIPSVEGRYAVLVGVYEGLNPLYSFLTASIGVLTLSLTLPFLLPQVDVLVGMVSRARIRLASRLARLYLWYLGRARRRVRGYVDRWGVLGLVAFVAAPLPGTGIWTGALASYVLGVDKKTSLLTLSVGGLLSNIITLAPVLLAETAG